MLLTTADERLTAKNCYNFHFRRSGQHVIISVGLEIFHIMQDGIENTVSENRVTRTTETEGITRTCS